MGGKKSFINKPLGSTGDRLLGKDSFLNTASNVITSASLTGGSSYLTNPNSPVNAENLGRATGKALTDTFRNIGEGLGEITGANALRKQAMQQQQRAEEEAKRQADVSDAMARNSGGDPTSIFLASGKRKKGTGSSTGSVGTSSSRNTGVQS